MARLPRTILLSTRNDHKLREFGRLLSPVLVEPLPPEVQLPPEDGSTFTENALGKAVAASGATGLVAIADDSGIESEALHGDLAQSADDALECRGDLRGEGQLRARATLCFEIRLTLVKLAIPPPMIRILPSG